MEQEPVEQRAMEQRRRERRTKKEKGVTKDTVKGMTKAKEKGGSRSRATVVVKSGTGSRSAPMG